MSDTAHILTDATLASSTSRRVEIRERDLPEPRRAEPWVAAGLLVTYSTIFWVGVITIVRWCLASLM